MTATLLSTLAVLVLPGLPAALALRLRPTMFAASLAPLSLLLVSVSAELGSLLGVPWTILSALVLGVLLGAVLLPLGPRHRGSPAAAPDVGGTRGADGTRGAEGAAVGAGPVHRSPVHRFFASTRGVAVAIVGGLLVGGVFLLVRALRMMGSIDAVSQSYDNVFHLNATRHILRHQDASAWVVGGMTRLEGSEGYYPALWHQAASLVTQLSGQDIVLASNVLMLVVAVVVWPLGLVAMVRTTTDAGPVGLFLTGALSGVTAAFPLTLMSWGIVLPYFLSVALLPAVVTAIVHLAGLAAPGPARLRPLQLLVLLVAGCGAVGLAHPQGVFAGIVLGVPILLWATVLRARELVSRAARAVPRFALTAGLTAVVMVASSVLWVRARPSEASAVWEPNASLIEAIGQVGSLSPNASPTFVPLGVVMLVSLLGVLLWTRSRWLVASWLVAGALSVATRATSVGDLRYLLTGNWYSDNNRVAAIVTIVAVPVLAVGIDAVARRAARSWPALRTAIGPLVISLFTTVVLTLSLLSPATAVNQQHLLDNWMYDVLLSDDERALLERLPEVVPEDAVIATNAWNGSSLAYAISDREVLNTTMGFQAPPEVHLLNAELDEAHRDPEVCDAMHEVGVDYALDFGARELHQRSATYTGLNEISETGAAEVVLQVGEAKLLRMLPCEGSDGSMIE